MTPAHMVRGSSDRTLEQIADPVLEDPVGRQADRIFDPLGFQELVDLRHGERCVSAEIDTRELALRPSTRSIQDRKSTRLNSSHLGISYAVFCLKKKTYHN